MEGEVGLLELTIRTEGVKGDGMAHHVIEVGSLDEHGWTSLLQACNQQSPESLTFLIQRIILMRKSSFFQSLLGGEFRESFEDHVDVIWDPVTFCFLLYCMCLEKLHDSCCNMELLFEGILFFGIEVPASSLIQAINGERSLTWVPKLWGLAKGLGKLPVSDACEEAFAINFEDAISQSNLQDLSSAFLYACLDHKDLTVTSERSLCEGVLRWFSSKHGRDELFFSPDLTAFGIFQKIRVSLLPLDFILGDVFESSPTNTLPSDDRLVRLTEELAKKDFLELLNSKPDDFTLRLSNHSVRLHLAGCQQLTTAVLFLSALQCARMHNNSTMDPERLWEAQQALSKLFQTRELNAPKWFGQKWCGGLALKNLWHLDLERCWRIDQKNLAAWLCLVCPNLKVLNLSQCSHLGVHILPQISASCQRLESVDLSLYYSSKPYGPQDTVNTISYLQSGYRERHSDYKPLACLTSLSLQGRSSLADNDLEILAGCFPNLSILRLGGCFGLTDGGLAKFLANYTNLTVLEAAHTAFARLSVEALLQNTASSDSVTLGGPVIGNCSLTTLDIEGCLESLLKMAQSWRRMTSLQLKECGTMTSDGASCLFICKALQKLDLQHNGLGLNRNFANCALVKLPLLQDLCLDTCDSLDKGYDSMEAASRRSLSVLRIIRCKALKNACVNSTRLCVKEMVLIEWTDNQERIRKLNEGL